MLKDSPMADEIVVASAVDELPSDYVHIYIDLQFEELQREVLARPSLSLSDRAWFEREANNLQAKYKEVLGAENSPLKDAALRAVASALCLSFYYLGGPQAIREFRLDQTARARERRMHSGLEFQTAVDEEARKLWAQSPEFLNNDRGTARNIYSAVAAAIDTKPNPPKWWNPEAETQMLASEALDKTKQLLRGEVSDETKRRRIEAIRKRISRIHRQDG
jgi:hypothetical protein